MNAADIKQDLTAGKNRPEWIFSSYAPAPGVPRQLFGGPQREQSMEEMRVRHYEAVASNNMNQAVQEAEALWQESVKQMDIALNDTQGAIKFILDGYQEHPNRIDITEGKTGTDTNSNQPSAPPNPFGQAQPSGPSPFGQASTSGGFGQPAQNPSPFGQPQSSGFGQPSTLGAGANAFGQSSSLGGGGGFGKPSLGGTGFGTSTNNASAFTKSPFGQASAPSASPFGAAASPSPFSQINQNSNPSPFSNPSATQQNPSPFGQAQQPSNPSPFGQPQQSSNPSPFGQPSTLGNPSPFAQAQQPAAAAAAAPSPFGQPSGPSGFAQAAQNPSPFGQMQQSQPAQPAQPNPFGQPQAQAASNPFGSQPAATAPFGQPAAPQGVPVPSNGNVGPPAIMDLDGSNDLNPLPRLQGETRRDPVSNRISLWKGRPVQYVNNHPCYLHPQDNKTLVRINFPNGPPDAASLRDSQAKEGDYTPEVAAQYEYFLQHGRFENGVIPTVPPKKDWISFDF